MWSVVCKTFSMQECSDLLLSTSFSVSVVGWLTFATISSTQERLAALLSTSPKISELERFFLGSET